MAQKAALEEQGHKVAYISVYGSQNYGLDIDTEEYKSDLDMKAVIVPTLDNLIANSKPISEVQETPWGQCDVKDIRSYFETLLKANPAYIETLFTGFYVIDKDFASEWTEIMSMREELVSALRAQFLRAIYGMMCEKEKALSHPYPSIIHKIEKWGYDGKQAHHVKRLQIMIDDYFLYGKPLEECFYPDEQLKPVLLDLKMNKPSLEVAKLYVERTMAYGKEQRDYFLSKIDESIIDYSIKDRFINLSQQIIRNKIVSEISRSQV